jgi:hypothetical protein
VLIQGSNNPLVIQFDTAVDNIPKLVVTLWQDCPVTPIKTWELADMTVSGDTAICPISEGETKVINADVVLEAKGLDGNGNTIFWDEYKLDLKKRRDKVISLAQVG